MCTPGTDSLTPKLMQKELHDGPYWRMAQEANGQSMRRHGRRLGVFSCPHIHLQANVRDDEQVASAILTHTSPAVGATCFPALALDAHQL
jgi:hypothetical protein